MSHFTYLHVHTHFSSHGGPASPHEWCRHAATLGYNALGVADRAPMAAFPAFAQAASTAGISPIYGVELDLLLPLEGKAAPLTQAVLLVARNIAGMSNLARLSSLAYAGWPQREEPLPWDTLAAHADGLALIVLTGDGPAKLASFVSAPTEKQSEWGGLLKGTFADGAFVGLPLTGQPGDEERAEQVALAAKNTGLQLVALPTARYLNPDDATSYQALKLARIRAGWPESPQANGRSVDGATHAFMRHPDQAAALFQRWPQAVESTSHIADMCRLDGDVWATLLAHERTQADHMLAALRELAHRQLMRITGAEQIPEGTSQRLEAELALIEKSGRAPAWLALSHLAAGKGTTSTARHVIAGAPLGTADGSLLAYALGLTPLDPMSYPQSPWLEPATKENDLTMPLPGIEVPASRRDDILAALSKELGAQRVAHAACAIHITPSAALQAAATLLNTPDDTLQELTATVVERGWAALERPETSDSPTQHQHDVIRIARGLRRAPISFKPDLDTVLLLPQAESALPALPLLRLDGRQFGNWVPWSEDTLCSTLLSAVSVQPSNALSTLDIALSLAAKYPSPNMVSAEVDLSAFPQLSEEAVSLVRQGQVVGVPYLSQDAAKGWEGEINAQTMSLLVARSVSARPTQRVQPLPDVEGWASVTEETGDLLIYKDQLATIAQKVAGICPSEAAMLRRALGNPDTGEGREVRQRFAEGCQAAGIPEEQAIVIWDALKASAPRLVSRQAAAAWARIAMWGVTIKAAHPAALLAAALAVSWEGSRTGRAPLLEEARRLGISILPPDANLSFAMPSLERDGTGWAIRWGLSLLPGWGIDSAQRLIGARPRQGFRSLREVVLATMTAEVSTTQVETLIRSGACDRLGDTPRNRSRLLELLPSLVEWAESSHNSRTNTQPDLFAVINTDEPPVEDEQSNQLSTPRLRYAQRAWEENNLGVAFTLAPEIDLLRRALDNCGDLRSRLLTTTQIGPTLLGQSVYLIGLLCSIETHSPSQMSRNGSKSQPADAPLAVGWLEDLDGSIELVAFPPSYKRHVDQWTEGNLVIVTARVSQHADREIYLLCQHIAPYFAEADEGDLSLKIKASRKAAVASAPSRGVEQQQAPITAKATSPQPQRAEPEPARAAVVVAETSEVRPVAQPTYKLIVTLPGSEDDHADIDTMIALNRLLEQHPGDDVVVLRIPYLPEIGAVTTAQLPRRVRHSPNLEARIRKLLGYDALATIKLIS